MSAGSTSPFLLSHLKLSQFDRLMGESLVTRPSFSNDSKKKKKTVVG